MKDPQAPSVEHPITDQTDLEHGGAAPQQADRAASAAFVTMLREHDRQLRAVAFRLVGDDVDDVLQTAYLRAFRQWHTFRGESAVGTWLHRIVYTAAIDHLRSRSRQAAVVDEVGRSLGRSMIEVVTGSDDRLDIGRALARLSPEDRAVLVLVDGQQLSYADAATVIAAPVGTIASRLHRARRALRRQLLRGAER